MPAVITPRNSQSETHAVNSDDTGTTEIRVLRYLKTRFVGLLAEFLLAVMFLLISASYPGDSLTSDEIIHIAAGYSYVRFRDARLAPEHPPLLKMLAAAPLLAFDLDFPLTHPAWDDDTDRM